MTEAPGFTGRNGPERRPQVGMLLFPGLTLLDLLGPHTALSMVMDVHLVWTRMDEPIVTDTGLRSHVLHTEPVGLVVRDDDPLAGQASVRLATIPARRWVQLPPDTDPVWTAYWTGAPAAVDSSAQIGGEGASSAR